MGGGDDNVGIAVPKYNKTISGNDNDNVLDKNRNNEGGNDLCNDANVVGKSLVMVTTVMALLTVMVAMTAIIMVTYLSVVTLLVKEKRK